jgi:hypothetical protein
MTGTKYTLSELITLYELEPELTEVLTEGRTDASLILWFLRKVGCAATVNAITDRIDVPSSQVRQRGQDLGNKGRLVTAALVVDEASPDEAAKRVTFVADADAGYVSNEQLPQASCLLWTDYTSVEMYCFEKSSLDKMLRLTFRAPEEIKAEAILDAIRRPLVDIFAARLVLQSIAQPVKMVAAVEKRCKVKDGHLVVDVQSLLLDSINHAGGPNKLSITLADLMERHAIQRATFIGFDERRVIHGHDFPRICCYYLKERHPHLFKEDRSAYRSVGPFANTLITCVDADQLAAEALFQRLLERCGILSVNKTAKSIPR